MEYIVAQYRIRTVGRHSDLAACGIRGFAPFVVESAPEEVAAMELHSECQIDRTAFGELTELSSFGFEADIAQCTLYRFEGGYLFEMVKPNESYIFILVPASMTVNGVEMSGIEMPMEAATGIVVDDLVYKCYQSSNTYDAGVYNINVY